MLNTHDYRIAPGGEGPQASQWKDKPHRLIYDLCAEVERLQALIGKPNQFRLLVGRYGVGSIEHGVIVVANKTDRIQTEAQLLTALRNGVSKWMKENEDGRAGFEYAGDDFNFGDLGNYLDPTLQLYLKAEGLEGFDLLDFDVADDMTYDTSLVNDDVAEVLDPEE